MTLSVGSKLGPYEILAAVGTGGMGEVYRAKDTRLDRTVAIKVLPSHLSENPEVRQRFHREARTISSLSHPQICTLHDIGHQDGTDDLVMEFLAPDRKLMAVSVRIGAAFESETPKPLFAARVIDDSGRHYDVSAEGDRFLIATPLGDDTTSPVTLVQNWTALLRKSASRP